jgi:ATP-dependent Zn protease
MRDTEQARLTDEAYAEALRLLTRHRAALDRVAKALLDKETLLRNELAELLADVAPESNESARVGTPQALPVSD